MSTLITQSVPLTTDASGVCVRDVRFGSAQLIAIEVELGSLETPDITITDEPSGRSLLAKTGLAADAHYVMSAQQQKADGTNLTGAFGPPVITGRVHVAIAGGGDTKTGRLVLIVNR